MGIHWGMWRYIRLFEDVQGLESCSGMYYGNSSYVPP